MPRHQQTQNICIQFVQRRSNVFDVGPTLYNVIQMFCVYWDGNGGSINLVRYNPSLARERRACFMGHIYKQSNFMENDQLHRNEEVLIQQSR